MQKRRWGSYKKGSAAAASQAEHAASSSEGTGTPFHQQPEHKSTIRSQLAGLRHRAAIRANKRQPRWTAAAAADADASAAAAGASYEEEVQEQPEATASLEYDSTEMSDGCNMASGEHLCVGGGAFPGSWGSTQQGGRACTTQQHDTTSTR